MTNQKMTEIINEFCEWSVMLASAGIILDENAINKTGGTAIYFTYPEVYAEDCRTITEEYEDAVYVEGVEGLAGNPKDVSMTLLNEFLLYYSAVYNLENMKIFDDDDIDEALAEMKKEFSGSINENIHIYGKPRVGETWTKTMMLEKIEQTNKEIEKAFENLRGLEGYEKLN